MPQEILVKSGTPKVWANATDWPGGGAHGFGDDDYQLDLTSLAATKARQGAKGDLGATRAASYSVFLGIEFGTAPTAGKGVEVYWSGSNSATAATGNAGGASGSDAAYKDSEEAEWVLQLMRIGAMPVTNDGAGTTQIMCINEEFVPPARYGMPVVLSNADQSLDTDAINMFVALVPNVDELQ